MAGIGYAFVPETTPSPIEVPFGSEKAVDWSRYVDHTFSFREHHTAVQAYHDMIRFGIDFAALLDGRNQPIGLIAFRPLCSALMAKFGQEVFGRKLLRDLSSPIVTLREETVVFSPEVKLAAAQVHLKQRLRDKNFEDILVTSENGSFIGMISVRDFILRENDNLRHREQELELQVARLSDSLNDLSQPESELVRAARIEERLEFVEGIEHEISGPLSVLNGAQEEINKALDDLAPDIPPDRWRFIAHNLTTSVEVAHDAAERITQVVRVMSRIARSDNRQQELIPVDDLVTSAIIRLAHKFKSGIEVLADRQNGELICCYPAQIGHVLVDLLGQIHRALGGKGRIVIEASRNENFLELSISYSTVPEKSAFPADPSTKASLPVRRNLKELDVASARTIIETNHGGRLVVAPKAEGLSSIGIKLPSRNVEEPLESLT